MHRLAFASTAVVAAAFTAATFAQDDADGPTMTIGSPAPALDISHWVKGSETDAVDGRVRVVEFWATWCGPCRASMPHISELQAKYADDVQVISVSDEPLSTVVGFLVKPHPELEKPWFDVIGYNLTTDPDKSVHKDYMRAAAQNGIPTAFIVGDDDHIEWIGHPMELDEPLREVVEGTWNRDAFKASWERRQSEMREMMQYEKELRGLLRNEEWTKALGVIDNILARDPGAMNYKMMKLDALTRAGDLDSAKAFGRELVQGAWDEPSMLNGIAWSIATSEGENIDLALALDAAERADSLTEHKDAAIIDTLARVWFEKGNFVKAIELQEKAIANADIPRMKADLEKTLEMYRTTAAQVN